MTQSIGTIVERLEATATASRAELALLLGAQESPAAALYAAADRVRAAAVGDDVHLRGLIEFSNYCRRNCLYCGLRRGRRGLSRYRMTPQEIMETAHRAADLGFRTLVLQSGEDAGFPPAALAAVVRNIKAECDVAVALSVGELPVQDYRLLREAGADRYLLRIETSIPNLYRELHPDSDWHRRLLCLHSLRSLGYQVGSGVIIGLPGQTIEMLADDLLFLQGLDLDMIGVGPFIPHPSTPLGRAPRGTLSRFSDYGSIPKRCTGIERTLRRSRVSPEPRSTRPTSGRVWRGCAALRKGAVGALRHQRSSADAKHSIALSLRFVACLRLLCPQALIPATSALGALHPEGRQMALRAGADVIMPNVTPTRYRQRYELYPGKICIGDDAAESRASIDEIIDSLGRRVAEDRGDSRRLNGDTRAGRESVPA
jgi:biotin synthase